MRLIILSFPLIFFALTALQAQPSGAYVTLQFEHIADHRLLTRNDSIIQTPSGEKYLVSKLKYYVSNIAFEGENEHSNPSPFLIEDGKQQEIRFEVPAGKYRALRFMLGLDSLLHCSGAQSGDLDPIHDMFWTWNSGYVVFKLEGKWFSAQGNANRLEHHLGGYRQGQQLSRTIRLDFDEEILLKAGDEKKWIIRLDLDKYWFGKEQVSPSREPVITKPGQQALRIAENFEKMFYLKPAL